MPGGAARIVYVGHATVLVELDGVRLLTDPLLRDRLMHLRRVGTVDLRPLQDVDAVLISHLHFDHLDLPSLRLLGRDVPLVVPRGAGDLLRRKGFRTVTELGAGEELEVGPLTIRGTPALHGSGRVPLGVRADPIGHVILGSRSVYFAGDTDVFDELASLAPVDVALLPITGWGSSLGPGHMDPRAAAEAARLLRASVAIPIHWATYVPLHTLARGRALDLDTPMTEFLGHLRALAPDADARVLRPGEATAV